MNEFRSDKGLTLETSAISLLEQFPNDCLKVLTLDLKVSRQFRNQLEGKPKPICTREFSRALSKLHEIATNLDWFIALFAPAVIGRSNLLCYLFYDTQLKTALCGDKTKFSFRSQASPPPVSAQSN